MLDVVPPDSSAPRPGRKPSAKSSSVVELDWRLPARLRRPVRDELRRQRRLRRQRKAIVSFKRRPIYAEPPIPPRTYQASVPAAVPETTSNRGIEHHTGDVYRHGRPAARTLVPPYAGSYMRRPISAAPTGRKKKLVVQAQPRIQPVSTGQTRAVDRTGQPRVRIGSRVSRPVPNRQTFITSNNEVASPVRQSVAAKPRQVRAERKLAVMGERDVPFSWQPYNPAVQQSSGPEISEEAVTVQMSDGAATAGITEPRRRFALPLHFSIWPRGWRSDAASEQGKKKV